MLAIEVHHQCLESSIIIGNLCTCIDLGHQSWVQVGLQEGLDRVPVCNLVILGFAHFCLELLHVHGSRGLILFQGVEFLNSNHYVSDRVECFSELGLECSPVCLVGGGGKHDCRGLCGPFHSVVFSHLVKGEGHLHEVQSIFQGVDGKFHL